MTNYGIDYQLLNSDGSQFNPCRRYYHANIVADSAAAACEKLKSLFSMVTVKVFGHVVESEITEDEYEMG